MWKREAEEEVRVIPCDRYSIVAGFENKRGPGAKEYAWLLRTL